MSELIIAFLQTTNEILAAGIVIISTSLLLYNITRNRNNRIARSSGILLGTVMSAYLVDVFISLGPDTTIGMAAGRLQWLGLAYIPAALFHLSDALLETTGLPSRGRRRMVTRLLYFLSTLFFIGATMGDTVAIPIITPLGATVQAQPLFIIYVAYFITALIVTFINVQRARKRCLTDSTRRRMAYLQVAILTPAIGMFPYSALFTPNDDLSLLIQILVIATSIVVIMMLIFLSYPLSFFGSDVPDRVVRVELLRFLLHGPGTGILAVTVILATRRATAILTLPGEDFMLFGVVAVVMCWQWFIAIALPFIERWLVYSGEDDEQLTKLHDLTDRILTRGDMVQLISATLEAICDYLRTKVAFVAILNEDVIDVVSIIGVKDTSGLETQLGEDFAAVMALLAQSDRIAGRSAFCDWKTYFIVPLYSRRVNGDAQASVIGIMGIVADTNPVQIIDTEDTELLYNYVQRIEQTLDDMLLQAEVMAALEGLLPQFNINRKRAAEVSYRHGRSGVVPLQSLPTGEEIYEQVRAALKHYWGGTGIARSRLLNLNVVQQEMIEADTPIHALRNVLHKALERLQPAEIPRSMMSAEWTLYNIVNLRFVEGKRVRDVARRMSLSEADLFRKQRMAIQAVADSILEMERESLNP